jgi:asparagine N-glycosylation enzyme membrane subunit Stt3
LIPFLFDHGGHEQIVSKRLLRTGAVEVLILAVILGFGVWLRWEPIRRERGADFDFDRAFHLRMVETVLEQGSVPERDPLGLPPDGKPVSALVPTALYQIVAAFHRLRGGRVETTALLFGLLVGTSIALPIYALARGLPLGRWPALAAAFAAVCCPAHVLRTPAHWLRYDGLGTLLIFIHLAAVAWGWKSGSPRPRIWAAIVAAIGLGLAVASWRISLILVLGECAVVLALFAVGRLRASLLAPLGTSLAFVLLISFGVPHLSHGLDGPFIQSRTGALLVVTLATIGLALAAGRRRWAWVPIGRPLLVGLLVTLALLVGRPSAYDAVGGAARMKIDHLVPWPSAAGRPPDPSSGESGVSAERRDISATLLATTREMASPSAATLLRSDYFFLLLPLTALYVIGRALPRRAPAFQRKRGPVHPPSGDSQSGGESPGLWFA